MIIIVSYLPWIILNSWKSNTSINSSVWLVELDSYSQFLASYAIFNHCAYAKWVDQIIYWKFSSFSIRDVASWGTLPTPQPLNNTYNNCFKVNLTKIGFDNGGHCFATIINLSHLRWVLAQAQLVTFWSFYFCMTMASPMMWTFILTWS